MRPQRQVWAPYPQHLARAQAVRPIASLQPPYSLLRRDVEGEIFAFCREHGLGVVVYSPMQCGLLSGRFDMSRVAADDWRRGADDFREPNLSVNLAFVDRLRGIAARYDKSVARLAIAWVLRRQEVTSAIVGARAAWQIEETVGGAGWAIDEADLQQIDELLRWRREDLEARGGVVSSGL